MTTTVPDVEVSHTAWVDVLAESGKSGKVRIQNKGGHELLVQFQTAAPLSNDINGVVIVPNGALTIEGEPMAWCRSIDQAVRVNVSEVS